MAIAASYPTDVKTLHFMLDEQRQLIESLKANLHRLLKWQFGPKSEHLNVDQLGLFVDDSVVIEVPAFAPADHAERSNTSPATSERRRAVRVLRNLPRVIEEIDVPEVQKTCPCCGEALSAFGHESSEQLHYMPARLEVHETRRRKYSEYDGSRIATEGVIVVTFNYRLGPLGWFYHPAITNSGATPATGQLGLLDIIAALQWVQRNVAQFGGDPDNVTIFGQSSGAHDIYALVLARKARGLFQKAIAQSGGFWNMTLEQAVNYRDDPIPGTPLSAREVVNALLIAAGRAGDAKEARAIQHDEPPEALATWLRGLPATALMAPYQDDPHVGYDIPTVVYDSIFLPAMDHHAQFALGKYNAVPMIIGGTRDEQKGGQASNNALVRKVNGRTEIRNRSEYEALNRFYSDWWNFMAVDDLLPRLRMPVYAYRFDWDDAPTAPSNLHVLYGASHALDLPFLFPGWETKYFSALFTKDNQPGREKLSATMISYWVEFARHGDPGTGTEHNLPNWSSWQSRHEKMVFGNRSVSMHAGSVYGEQLLKDIWTSPYLTTEEKCAAFLDDTIYPAYPLAELKAHGCRRY